MFVRTQRMSSCKLSQLLAADGRRLVSLLIILAHCSRQSSALPPVISIRRLLNARSTSLRQYNRRTFNPRTVLLSAAAALDHPFTHY